MNIDTKHHIERVIKDLEKHKIDIDTQIARCDDEVVKALCDGFDGLETAIANFKKAIET